MTGTQPAPLFRSFFQGGFECSTHKRRDGRRLDLIAATAHDRFAFKDYTALQRLGLATVRDGLRWHLIESRPGRYDFASVAPLLRAASMAGTEVIWDLCHYGWPDDIDVFSPDFIDRFGNFARAFCLFLRDETDGQAWISPLNEPSFLSWAGGDAGYLNPFQRERGFELKCQIVRGIIRVCQVVRDLLPQARIVHCEPAIHIECDPSRPWEETAVRDFRLFQFQALDMISGQAYPELGGSAKHIDVIGLNYYWNNQWIHQGKTLTVQDPLYRPFRELLAEFHRRYQRPVFVSETGNEDDLRPVWFSYVSSEVFAAIETGVPVQGVCLYPVLNYPGWDNDRHCHCGLLDYADANGNRELYRPLADELQFWQKRFRGAGENQLAATGGRFAC